MRETFIARPWALAGLPSAGAHHLHHAVGSGRGVLVSYCHLGPFPGIAVSVAEHVPDVSSVVGSWLLKPWPEDPQPQRKRAWRSMFEDAGVPMIDAKGSRPALESLLNSGHTAVIAFDWPGPTETRFLGRPTLLASGTARLAAATGALIVPAIRQLRHHRVSTTFDAPLDPRDHTDWLSLQNALAARHGGWISACPPALEDPRRPGAWQSGATAARWDLPPEAPR